MPTVTVRGVNVVKRFGRGRRILGQLTRGNVFDMIETADVYVDAMRRQLLLPGTGRVYSSPEKGFHVASAPGQPPATWTDTLFWAIDSLIIDDKRVGVGIDSTAAPYWVDLEYGTIHMAPRPFVRVALALANRRAVGQFRRRLRERAQKIVKGMV